MKQLYNMYGPTEGTCGATIKRLLPYQPVTVGVPNMTTRIYVLTSRKTLAPPGVIGEVYLAGVQVASGYLNMSQQTQERFLGDSIWPAHAVADPGEVMYKTGDRGYWTPEGEIALLGRSDREIKLKGFRLDMGDLEIRIARACPFLTAVAIAHRKDQLVAMVQPADIDVRALRDELREALPQYAMPHVIIAVHELPVTAGGKTDYKAVSEANIQQRTAQQGCDQLTTPVELQVAKAYRLVLQLPDAFELTASSSFVELGGHSLRQFDLVEYLTAAFGMQLSLKMTITCPTIGALAKAIEERINTDSSPSHDRLPSLDEELATPIETEWVTKYRSTKITSSFNVCYSARFDQRKVDRGRLVDAWNAVLTRHRLLACRYVFRNAKEVIRVDSGCVPCVQTPCSIDLRVEANRPFVLERKAPVRIYISDGTIMIALSHVVADYTALAILMRDASNAYLDQLSVAVPRSYSMASSLWDDPVSDDSLTYWTNLFRVSP